MADGPDDEDDDDDDDMGRPVKSSGLFIPSVSNVVTKLVLGVEQAGDDGDGETR